VQVLRTASGDESILLRPELLNNLAASIVLQARRNPKGLGALEEARLLDGEYAFEELEGLPADQQGILLDAAAVLFVEHNVCFRESLGPTTFLIFPELINRKRPQLESDVELEDGVSYTVTGSVENVYAALVVLLGYTPMFTRTDQWQDQAEYEVEKGEVCGFRQMHGREGELDFVLYFAKHVGQPTRLLFQGLFEKFLAGREVTVTRFPPLVCPKCGYRQERAAVVRRTHEGSGFIRCSDCGKKIGLPKVAEEIALAPADRQLMDQQELTARRRSQFETVVTQVKAFVADRGKEAARPSCFVSYAWGVPVQERWVERQLATDLRNAGIEVILDQWRNAEIGANVARFVGAIEQSDFVVVVGTPLYREKYENKISEAGSVVAAEVDLINLRLIGTEEQKETVLPTLLEGSPEKSLPPLMRGKVYADFRSDETYFPAVFDLILTLYGIPFDSRAVADLREELREGLRPIR